MRDLVEVLLGTALRIGEALALRPCDVDDTGKTMILTVRGTVILKTGHGAFRQDHPKTEHSVRSIAVPAFAARVLRVRMAGTDPERTIFANRKGGPLSPFNARRTFRDFLKLAGMEDSGITFRWFRRTGATVIARGAGTDAAAVYLGHGSTAITEGHYIEPVITADLRSAGFLERTLNPESGDGALLTLPSGDHTDLEERLDEIDGEPDHDGEAELEAA